MIKKVLGFGIVGILATIIDFGLLFILKSVIGINVYIASVISFTVSLVFNYIYSMKYVFIAKEGMSIFKQSIIFISTAILGLVLNQIIMYISIDFLGIYYMIGKLIATTIVMVFNFISRYFLLEK